MGQNFSESQITLTLSYQNNKKLDQKIVNVYFLTLI